MGAGWARVGRGVFRKGVELSAAMAASLWQPPYGSLLEAASLWQPPCGSLLMAASSKQPPCGSLLVAASSWQPPSGSLERLCSLPRMVSMCDRCPLIDRAGGPGPVRAFQETPSRIPHRLGPFSTYHIDWGSFSPMLGETFLIGWGHVLRCWRSRSPLAGAIFVYVGGHLPLCWGSRSPLAGAIFAYVGGHLPLCWGSRSP